MSRVSQEGLDAQPVDVEIASREADELGQDASTMAQTALMSQFERLMVTERLPEPGPDHYAARRALWLQPPPELSAPASPSPSRIKLEALLNQSGAVESEEVWKAGLKNVWKGLVGGNQLRKRLPLGIVVSLIFTHLAKARGGLFARYSMSSFSVDDDTRTDLLY